LLAFRYDELDRTVESYLYGIHRDSGNEILSAYGVGGLSHSSERPGWRTFVVAEIGPIRVLGETLQPRFNDYNPTDEGFRFVFARLF
jgi:hypothetical protein